MKPFSPDSSIQAMTDFVNPFFSGEALGFRRLRDDQASESSYKHIDLGGSSIVSEATTRFSPILAHPFTSMNVIINEDVDVKWKAAVQTHILASHSCSSHGHMPRTSAGLYPSRELLTRICDEVHGVIH
jgi:hypothetical protein